MKKQLLGYGTLIALSQLVLDNVAVGLILGSPIVGSLMEHEDKKRANIYGVGAMVLLILSLTMLGMELM